MNEDLELTFLLGLLQNETCAKPNSEINWPLFYKLVRRHRVWHQVFNALKHNNLAVPIVSALERLCQNDKRRLLITAGETVRIARAFTQQSIDHCFVKGTLLNVHLYGSLNTRPCRDIDVWVDTSTYAAAMSALLSLGYQQHLPDYELTGFKKRWYMHHKHDMAFFHPEHKMVVELHFRLSYPGLDFFPWNAVRLSPIHLLNVPVLTLTDDYHLLYLMIHGATHAWTRLRWLQDIALFIQNRPCDLMHVYDLAKQLHCQHIVEQSLMLVSAFFVLDHPALTQLIQTPSRRARRLTSLAHEFITADYEITDGLQNIRMFCKYRIYLAILTVQGQKCRTILGDLFKLDELFGYVTFPDKLSFMYYAIYPLWVVTFVFKSRLISPASALHQKMPTQ